MSLKPLLLLLLIAPLQAEWDFREEQGRIDILEDGKVLTSYHEGRVPCVYPLPSASGANLARHWPLEKAAPGEDKDHPHHRSLWFSHGSVNGFDFWAWTGKGDPEIRHLGASDFSKHPDGIGFTAKLSWVAGGGEILHETRRHRFRRTDPETLEIEIESTLVPADGEVVFGDTKEGAFAIRVDRTLRNKGRLAKGHLIDSEGREDGACWGKRASWCALHGPDELGEPAVLAILDHPDNLRHPTWWHARDYGLLAANPFGIHDFESKPGEPGRYVIPKGGSLVQRYLVVLHHGTVASAGIDLRLQRFSQPETP